MAINKVLPGNETIILIPAIEINGIPHLAGNGTVAPISTPTTAIINYWAGVTSQAATNASAGGNISCAILDDKTLRMTDSETDGDKTVCSVGNSVALTLYKFEAEFTTLRDQSLTDTGVFNLARDLLSAPDLPYIIVHRIGKSQTATFAVGDYVDLYYVNTDIPVPVYGSKKNLARKQSFIPKGVLNTGYALAS